MSKFIPKLIEDDAIFITPCPFCGNEININDSDTLHRSPIFWTDDMSDKVHFRRYLNRTEALRHTSKHHLNTVTQCWELHCNTIYGGCGVEMSGDTRDEVITKWNQRT